MCATYRLAGAKKKSVEENPAQRTRGLEVSDDLGYPTRNRRFLMNIAQAEFGKEAQSLASLIDYQSGSVVSRTLLSKSAGTVTLFAFDKSEGLSEHTTPYDALVFIVDGGIEVTIDGEPQQLAGGDVLLMPAGKPHAVHSSERSKMLLVMIRE